MIKRFAIFKNEKAVDPQPGYRMVGKDENDKNITLGSIWLKEHKGVKFYSGVMKDEFVKEDGSKIEGYVILSETEYQKLKNGSVTTEEINPDDIPF